MIKQHRPNAFSLVELSIVLVILGLLVGGILAGQSLIRADELRDVSTGISKLTVASHAFRDKYFAMPGDMNNATKFWGVLDADPATCKDTASTTTATCDGNGDGMMGSLTGSFEMFRIWQHMANAGLIEGSYTGTQNPSNPGSDRCNTGVNCPAFKLEQASARIAWYGNITGNTFFYDGSYGNMLIISKVNGPIMKADEMWNIDTKIDDGKPHYGRMIAYKQSSSANYDACVAANAVTSEYNLSSTDKECAANWRNF